MTDEPTQHDITRSDETHAPADADASAEKVLAEWRVHLFLANPKKSVAAALILAVALVLVQLAFHSTWLTTLGALILVGSLSDWLFPITYRLTTRAASYKNVIFRKRIAWDDVRSTYVSDFGMKLSPFASRSRLEPFRALIVRFGNDGTGAGAPGSRSTVMRIVNEHARCKREAGKQ